MKKLCLLFVSMTSLSSAQVLLPLAQGNSWTLRNPYISDTITLSIVSDQMMGTKRRIQLRFDNPWVDYDYILNAAPSGTVLEGIVWQGVTMHFDTTSGWFRTDVSPGTTWSTPLGPMKLVSNNATVATPTATFRNCWKYQFGSDAEAQIWYLAPNVGIVQFGDGPPSFGLSGRTLNPYVAPVPSTIAGACPKIGLHPNPATNDDHSQAGMEAILSRTVTAGARFLHVEATWALLEPSPGTFDTTEIARSLALAQKYNVDVAFTIRSVDTSVMAIPSDLRGRAINDPVFISRFNALLTALAPVLNSKVRWVNLANEVNLYYESRPNELSAFQSFFAAASSKIKTLRPGTSVGLVFAYSQYRSSDAYVKPLVAASDHVSFTYYPIRADYTMEDPALAGADLAEMVAAAAGKPLIFTELGYSSKSPSSTGPAAQSTFYSNVLTALAKYSGKVAAASFLTLNDPPDNLIASLTSYFGISAPLFGSYLGGLGIADNIGVAKPAYTVWSTRTQSFSANVGCTVP